jgi:predicted AlkP superfamily pyrophosphatase or phosphodiesterase
MWLPRDERSAGSLIVSPTDPRTAADEVDDQDLPIQHGRFYSMEGYGRTNPCAPAEIDLCAQLTLLLRRHDPHYALLHTCSADTLGHTFRGIRPSTASRPGASTTRCRGPCRGG